MLLRRRSLGRMEGSDGGWRGGSVLGWDCGGGGGPGKRVLDVLDEWVWLCVRLWLMDC